MLQPRVVNSSDRPELHPDELDVQAFAVRGQQVLDVSLVLQPKRDQLGHDQVLRGTDPHELPGDVGRHRPIEDVGVDRQHGPHQVDEHLTVTDGRQAIVPQLCGVRPHVDGETDVCNASKSPSMPIWDTPSKTSTSLVVRTRPCCLVAIPPMMAYRTDHASSRATSRRNAALSVGPLGGSPSSPLLTPPLLVPDSRPGDRPAASLGVRPDRRERPSRVHQFAQRVQPLAGRARLVHPDLPIDAGLPIFQAASLDDQ